MKSKPLLSMLVLVIALLLMPQRASAQVRGDIDGDVDVILAKIQ